MIRGCRGGMILDTMGEKRAIHFTEKIYRYLLRDFKCSVNESSPI